MSEWKSKNERYELKIAKLNDKLTKTRCNLNDKVRKLKKAKGRIEQLESSLDEVAEKWAIAQVNYEDCARRNILLEVLVQDWCDLYENPDYGDCIRLRNRMKSLGLMRGDV